MESMLQEDMSMSGDDSAEEILKKQMKLKNSNLDASSSGDESGSYQRSGKMGKGSLRKQK